jgi:NADH dehydrogenase
MQGKRIAIFGGSGFLGRVLVQKLAQKGAVIKIGVRAPDEALFLRPMGHVGQIIPTYSDITNPASVAALCEGADYVVNLVGILYQKKHQKFNTVHIKGAQTIAEACKKKGIQRLIHISALGAEANSPSKYAATKAKAEKVVLAADPMATILRPSLMIGPDDHFFNLFASMSRISPVLPLFGGGLTRFQPVYVGDVATAIIKLLEENTGQGKIFELGGPSVYTFKELMTLMLKTIKRKKILLPLPFFVGEMLGTILQLLPHPLLTRDQIILLKKDSIVSKRALTFKDLKITPSSLEAILPTYLPIYRPAF